MFSLNFDRFIPDTFQATYKCYSVSMLPDERQNLEKGGKIIMPPSALHTLTRLNTVYPMLFKLTNTENNRHTHSGVLEFIAEEGKVYVPYWMMRNLLLDEGSMLQVQSASLPVATFSKFQPQSVDFLDIHNPKAVLENALRNFACLTTGDVIAINYNNKVYELSVLQTKPGAAVSIIECDMNVEFEAPIGYQEPTIDKNKTKTGNKHQHNQIDDEEEDDDEIIDDNNLISNKAFTGQGNRLDGKPPKEQSTSSSSTSSSSSNNQTDSNTNKPNVLVRGMPDYNYQIGTIRFYRKRRPNKTGDRNSDDSFKPFEGEGQTLIHRKQVV